MLDDIGLDSMMAMDFRVRINTMFSIDLPVLEILRGVSVNSLADRVLAELHSIHGDAPAATEEPAPPQPAVVDDDVDRLMDELSDADLRELLAELEAQRRAGSGRGARRDCSAQCSVRGLSKAYGRLQAVRDLDLDVGYGEIFAILGPNGAGKSTTIEILEGHRKRDAGQVRVLGEDPGTAGRSWRARIGIVLQEASDFGMLTVLETVRMFAKCYGEARVPEELLELVGLASTFRFEGQDALRGTATPARRRSRHHRQARTAVPGRTDHRVRSRGEAAVLGSHQAVGRRRHHHSAHHPLPGGGRRAGGPRRGHRRRPGGRGGFAGTVDRTRGLGRDGAVDGGRRGPRRGDRPSDRADQAAVDGRARNWLSSPSHDPHSKTPICT